MRTVVKTYKFKLYKSKKNKHLDGFSNFFKQQTDNLCS